MVNTIYKYIPFFIKRILIRYLTNIKINNYFKTNYPKTALLSYVVMPFKKDSFTHTNYFEAQSWAKILFELGYNVDIIHYENTNKIDLQKYDLICGFGDVFQHYFETQKLSAKTIFYATGMHVCHQNNASLSRVKDVHTKKNVWLVKSARFVEKTWSHQTTLVDGIIALGNDICAKSYRKYYDGKIFSIPAPYYQTQNINDILKGKLKNSNRHFLWFGSTGLIHKGLDLLLDYFSKNPEITLHICGPIEREPLFVESYKKELYNTSNIITYGFVDIKSNLFKNILMECAFVIFPSCSEGGASSVITAIGNGGLIPIITKETTIKTGFEIWINSFDINQAIRSALKLTKEEVLKLQKKNIEYVKLNHSQENYYIQLKKAIANIIDRELI